MTIHTAYGFVYRGCLFKRAVYHHSESECTLGNYYMEALEELFELHTRAEICAKLDAAILATTAATTTTTTAATQRASEYANPDEPEVDAGAPRYERLRKEVRERHEQAYSTPLKDDRPIRVQRFQDLFSSCTVVHDALAPEEIAEVVQESVAGFAFDVAEGVVYSAEEIEKMARHHIVYEQITEVGGDAERIEQKVYHNILFARLAGCACFAYIVDLDRNQTFHLVNLHWAGSSGWLPREHLIVEADRPCAAVLSEDQLMRSRRQYPSIYWLPRRLCSNSCEWVNGAFFLLAPLPPSAYFSFESLAVGGGGGGGDNAV